MAKSYSWKTVAKHDKQNQAISVEFSNHQYIKGGTRLTRGQGESPQRVQIKSVHHKMLSDIDWPNNPENKKKIQIS